jgi:amino acid adenylation domain-containing protein
MFNSCIDFLEKQVIENGDKVAITDRDGSIKYNELRTRSLNIAKAISSDFKNRPIGVFLPKSINCVTSFMGVLYTGNFYVPLDVKSPLERLNSLVENLTPAAIITQTQYIEKFKNSSLYNQIQFIDINELPVGDVDFDYKSIIKNVLETDPIYSIYTSGSTGLPKGVVLSHSNVHDYLQWFQKTYKVNEETVLGNQSPFVFDVSVTDIYMCLKCGVQMHIIPEYLFSFPIKLIEYLNEHKINFIIWVPSVLVNIANAKTFEALKPKYVQNILFAGEPMPNKQLNYWRQYLPDALYSNMYGPTEATVIASYYIVDREFKDSDPLPMGKQVSNAELFVLAENGELVKGNEVGELYVKGTSVAMGYWNNLEATKKAFVQNPLNGAYPEIVYKTGDLVSKNEFGELVYSGRIDSQIKHMGYRIELGEIENAVSNINSIVQSCVLYNKKNSEIVLFYQTEDNDLNDLKIRTEMTRFVPKYMLPTQFFNLINWPLNSSGKIDRKKLSHDFLS